MHLFFKYFTKTYLLQRYLYILMVVTCLPEIPSMINLNGLQFFKMLRWTPWIVRALLFGFFHRQHLISSRLASNLSISSNDVRNMNCLQVQSVPLVYLTAIFQYPSSQWTRHSLLRDWTSEHLPMRDRHKSNWPHQFRWTFVSGFFC